MDFQTSQLPSVTPLEDSFAENAIESDLKKLFSDLLVAYQAAEVFDANVLGAAHLGSLDLIRKTTNADGLVLLAGDREDSATRYLYRAWKSGDAQGRGLHFLRTYLQMLYPNMCKVEQQWQDKAQTYPTGLYVDTTRVNYWLYALGETGLKLDGHWKIGGQRPLNQWATEAARLPDTSNMFLTSRINVTLDFSVQVRSIVSLMTIIRSVIPARFVPYFKFILSFVLDVQARFESSMGMQKASRMRYPWNGRTITSSDDAKWSLGVGGTCAKLGLPFGAFKLGELRGGVSKWHLKNTRVETASMVSIQAEAVAWRVETLPPDLIPEYVMSPPPTKLAGIARRLDGSWSLGAFNQVSALSPFRLDGRRLKTRKTSAFPLIGHFKIRNIVHPIPLPARQTRLSLSGRWRLGCPRQAGFEINTLKVL